MSRPLVISDAEFQTEVLEADRPVLAYFWAAWCGPCRLVSPSIDWAAAEYADQLKIVKIEIDPNPETVKAYKVEGVPALRFFQAGQLVKSFEGPLTKAALQTLLDEVVRATV